MISEVLVINIAFKRTSIVLERPISWVLVDIGVRIAMPWIKITLRVIVQMMDVWTLVKMCKCDILNIKIGKLSIKIIYVRNAISQIWLLLLLLQLMDKTTMLHYSIMEIHYSSSRS